MLDWIGWVNSLGYIFLMNLIRKNWKKAGERKMKYKCIKEMCLPKCDADGFEIPNEYGFVSVGSIWERDDKRNIIGGDVHLDSLDDDSDFGWVEMPFGGLREHFALIE